MTVPDPDKAADLLEAALSGFEDLPGGDQSETDLDNEIPLIDGYLLLRLLGEGGFGLVYEAEQCIPIQRRVAIKVLRPDCKTRDLLARFEQERQALAIMNHPHIARIYDAGETADGRPFIAMELVDGLTIDRYAGTLDAREKVSLMRDVCRAVAHAHHKGVIHRDLKPSNILITTTAEGTAEPRVIDFGIAKALDGPLVSKVMFTRIRQVVGTPGYMSPERIHTSQIPASADTRTDVFSLGAILWELLTGMTPVQTVDATGTRVDLPDSKSVPAELRWIAEMATDAVTERRYPTADILADDLTAWLDGEPIKAAPRSALYFVSKWAMRHRVAATALLMLALSLFGFLFVLLQKNREISHALAQKETSERETRRATANEKYAAGIMRERRRPGHAMAHWAESLRNDPGNRASLGIALATVRHHPFPRPVAPAVPLPPGDLQQVALSANGDWAALILEGDAAGAGAKVHRCRKGENIFSSYEGVETHGRLTMIAVSNEGIIAIAGSRGPLRLLQPDHSWKPVAYQPEGLRDLAWTSGGQLWMIGATEVVRCDETGSLIGDIITLDRKLTAWCFSSSGDALTLGLTGGLIRHLNAEGAIVNERQAPIPPPFTKLAANEDGSLVAAAWANGQVWLSSQATDAARWQGSAVLKLQFLPSGNDLLVLSPDELVIINAEDGTPGSGFTVTSPLHCLVPAGPSAVLTQPAYGRPAIRHLHDLNKEFEIPGVDGPVVCASTPDGRVLVIIDDENTTLEWLDPGTVTDPVQERTADRKWHTLSFATADWTGIDGDGWICEISGDDLDDATPRWRVSEGFLRLAAVSAAGDIALIDEGPGPGIILVREKNATRHLQNWGKPSTLALSPDGRFATLGFPTGEVRIFDTVSGAELANYDWKRGPVTAVTFIGTDQIALAASSQVRVWNWRDDFVLPTPIDLPGTITALSPDRRGKRLAATSDGSIHVIDIETGRRLVGQLRGPTRATIVTWAGSDDGTVVAATSDGKTYSVRMPPYLDAAPDWLPDWIEHFAGVRIDGEARVVRLRASSFHPLPENAPPALREWLMNP
jgi:serine/threonine protein kinase/WD40 repeat protein